MHLNYTNLIGKLQNTFLKFGVVWILHPEIWEIRFHTLKFHSFSKTQTFISDLHMWLLSNTLACWCVIFLPKQKYLHIETAPFHPNSKHKTIHFSFFQFSLSSWSLSSASQFCILGDYASWLKCLDVGITEKYIWVLNNFVDLRVLYYYLSCLSLPHRHTHLGFASTLLFFSIVVY